MHKCAKCDDFSDNGKCEYGKFHGSPGAMETHQALVLFKRSTLWVFRYTEYVSDGDAKVLKYLNERNIYDPGIEILKVECANHLAKRASAALFNFAKSWKLPSSTKAAPEGLLPEAPTVALPAKCTRKGKSRSKSGLR